MKYMLTFAIPADKSKRDAAFARFLETGGQPPKGVKLLGRWTKVDMSGGYDLLETDNPEALADMAVEWNDLLDIQIIPVLEDQSTAAVVKRATAVTQTARR
jgi:Protein of unknown function (DUF3303)